MEKGKGIALLLAVVLLMGAASGCAAKPSDKAPAQSGGTVSAVQESSAPGEEPQEGAILEQMEALYQKLDTSRLPTYADADEDADEYSYQFIPLSEREGTKDTLPPQLINDTPEAYELAQAIMNTQFGFGNILEDFEDVDSAYKPAMLKTAIYHTPPIRFEWTGDSSGTAESFENPNHVVAALIKREVESGRMPSDLYYADDVHDTLAWLFGEDVEVYDMDQDMYYYYMREGIYTRVGDFGGPMWQYPQLTSIEKTENGYIAEAVPVWALDRETPLEIDDQPLTAENFETLTAALPKYRYTFEGAEDGHLVLRAFQTLRAKTDEVGA